MKYDATPLLTTSRLDEARNLGHRLTELRQAYHLRQADVAARAGLSRSTAVLIEKGDPGRTIEQILRYLHAIAPELTLESFLLNQAPALLIQRAQQRTQRVHLLSDRQLKEIDF